MKNFNVCVYAICKNKVQFVDRWMDAMIEADLVVVTDTGSTDGTIERLREKGAVVYEEVISPWRWDTARNIALDHVPEDMTLCVCTDLSEWFAKGWRKCLEKAWIPEAKKASFIHYWPLKEDLFNRNAKLFRVHTRKHFCWVHPLYEELRYEGSEIEITVYVDGMLLNHSLESTGLEDSRDLLLEMAEEEFGEEKDIIYDLGKAYIGREEWEKSIAVFKGYLSLKTVTSDKEKCMAMKGIAYCYEKLVNYKEACCWYFRAIAESPKELAVYKECARMACEIHNWEMAFYMVEEIFKLKEHVNRYTSHEYREDYWLHHIGSISCYQLGMYAKSLGYAKEATRLYPSHKGLLHNLTFIENKMNTLSTINPSLSLDAYNRLIHTLLFFTRLETWEEDKKMATTCLKSLEKGSYKTIIIYNQGYLTNEALKDFLKQFNLNCIVIGGGSNTGTVVGRQSCFEYIWSQYPLTSFISELHLDMVFTHHWEDPLIDYLDNNDEALVSAGIIDKNGNLSFLETKVEQFDPDLILSDDFLMTLRCNKIIHGFTNPCIHVSKILQVAGGYNPKFLKGKQCFEDDSMLLGYYYYYGTRAGWHPKINYHSVVYHAVAGQRLTLGDSVQVNYNGLVKQYGAMGLKHLSELHKSAWHIHYFKTQYETM